MKQLFILITLVLVMTSCEEEKTVYVANHTITCDKNNTQKCLLVKEKETDEWHQFSDSIIGFTYEEGFSYQLKIKITKGNDSKLVYTLEKIVSKTKTPSSIYNTWTVNTITGFNNQTGKSPNFTIKDGKIVGDSGCNHFNGTLKVDDKGLFKADRLMSTKMYCEKTAKLETAFFNVFEKANHYLISGNSIQILDNNGTVLLSASLQEKLTKPIIQIRYSATSRSFGSTLMLKGNTLTLDQVRPSIKKSEKELNDSDINKITTLVQAIDVNQIEKLTPPSNAFTYDGAAGAMIELSIDGKTYRTPTFDYGNPPEAIKPLIKALEELK